MKLGGKLKYGLAIASTFVLLGFAGCAVGTTRIEQRIELSSSLHPEKSHGGSLVLMFRPTVTESIVIPGIWHVKTYGAPYKCRLSIVGPFEEITNAELKISVGVKYSKSLQLDSSRFKKRALDRGEILFRAGFIPFDHDFEIERSFTASIRFTSKTDRGLSEIKLENSYNVVTRRRLINEWLEGLGEI